MKTALSLKKTFQIGCAALLALCAPAPRAHASIAYGSINNFDTVNDTGVATHGFEIELDDIHSTDITYTYDYNHYGVPKITEDNTTPAHPKVLVRYESAKKSDGTWAAYTAVPSAPIPPTGGHQFTNPSVNFGGEHFGVGYRANPSGILYNWLIDDGSGNLIHGGAVNIATPVFAYVAPAAPAAPAVVQAVIAPPPPPVPDPLEFGTASWVKEIRTTTHKPDKVRLEDLVSSDPEYPTAKNWTNGEPSEVEVEWQLLQVDHNAGIGGGPNGELAAGDQNLPNADEVVTRRYEFYKYTGPIDSQTGEAMADTVAVDNIHGTGSVLVNGSTINLTTVQVVGDFIGAQMSGFDAAPKLGLVDHVQDGELNTRYPDRTVVIGGSAGFLASTSGTVPTGLAVNPTTGVLRSRPEIT